MAIGAVYYYSGGLALRGVVGWFYGRAIASNLILTATLAGPGSSGVAERLAGANQFGMGIAALGAAVFESPGGLSLWPGGNTANFIRDGGMGRCAP